MVSTVEVRDIAKLINAVRQISRGFGHTQYWFRGHAFAGWKLVPSVHRNYDAQGEHNLMARFRLAAPTRYEKCPELQDWASWSSLMQHYGLPTRLLDWSGSLLAGASDSLARWRSTARSRARAYFRSGDSAGPRGRGDRSGQGWEAVPRSDSVLTVRC
jgi:FRG domain-containing protein